MPAPTAVKEILDWVVYTPLTSIPVILLSSAETVFGVYASTFTLT